MNITRFTSQGFAAAFVLASSPSLIAEVHGIAIQTAWKRTYSAVHDGTGDDSIVATAVDKKGAVAVTGTSWLGSSNDYYTIKYSSAGTVMWSKRHQDPNNRNIAPVAIAADQEGNVIVTGYAYSKEYRVPDHSSYYFNLNYYTVKYASSSGKVIWEKRYNGSGNGDDVPSAMTVDAHGNVIVTGYSYNGDGNISSQVSQDYCTVKYAADDGTLIWDKRYDGTAHWEDTATAVAVDSDGNVIVTGSSSGKTGFLNDGYDYCTIKYAESDGTKLWEHRYNSNSPPLSNWDLPTAIAVDKHGNVVVTGDSRGDFYTAKYAASNGAQIWERRGPVDARFNSSHDVALDSVGNVFVSGTVSTDDGFGGDNLDYYTAKYNAATGKVIWQKRYAGPREDGDDTATAMATDRNGNVIVTGTSQNSSDQYIGDTYDIFTISYGGNSGKILWKNRINGPADRADFGTALNIDKSGNIFVTGSVFGKGWNFDDYFTMKIKAPAAAPRFAFP